MGLTRKDLKERAEGELNVLDGLIGYAEKMIYEEGKRAEYGPLRRHAYGKTVVIETEKQGVLTFRLSSTPAVYPNMASGYATPHSPVGRLCSFLQPGDEDESPRWGDYRVLEIRLFNRFDGTEFEPNVRNFLHMKVQAEDDKKQIENLRRFVQAAEISKEQEAESIARSVDADQVAPVVEITESPEAPTLSILTVDTIAVIEDEEDAILDGLELDEEDADSGTQHDSSENYYGLSEAFYVNRTRQQDEVISRSPIGPMFVEGVAGSGKTSAALGRTKMLCDFNAANVTSESEFREIAGRDLDYWSGRFAGQFSQEGSVGFVRTGELIQYLKETCRRLDVSNLPVQEYPELRSRLQQHRKLERSRSKGARWSGLPEPRGTHAETTMAWLRVADRAVADHWAQELSASVPTLEAITASFDVEHRPRAQRVAQLALRELQREVDAIVGELSNPGSGQRFALDRLAARLHERIERVRQSVLGKNVLWVTLGATSRTSSNEREIAELLVADHAPLFLRSQARLVFLREDGPSDPSLTLLSSTGEVLAWSEDVRVEMDKGSIRVRDAAGRTFVAKASSVNDLHLRLLPEAIDKPFVLRDGALRPLRLVRGLGKEMMTLLPTASVMLDEADESEGAGGVEQGYRRKSVDAVFNALTKQSLLQPLAYLADAYAQALANRQAIFPDTTMAARIAAQLQERKLADEDIDLLLCLAHIVGRDFTGKPQVLAEPGFYQSVFIDEVQDFTEQQVFLMAEQARSEYRAVTVVGDIAQKLHNGSQIEIKACFPGQPVETVKLTENLRQLEAPGLALFSACFRARLQDGLTDHSPSPLLRERLREYAHQLRGPELLLVEDDQDLLDQVVDALSAVKDHQTAAVLLPEAGDAYELYERCKGALAGRMMYAEFSQTIDLSRRHVRHFTSVAHAKGLEFDVVIVPFLERYDLGDGGHVNRLYVALTRARRKLVVMSEMDRPVSAFDEVWRSYEDSLALL